MAMKAGLDEKMTDDGNLDEILPEWEKKLKGIKIPAFFNKMPQETGKTFPSLQTSRELPSGQNDQQGLLCQGDGGTAHPHRGEGKLIRKG